MQCDVVHLLLSFLILRAPTHEGGIGVLSLVPLLSHPHLLPGDAADREHIVLS